MLLRISEKITDILVVNKIITHENREIYRFGVKQGIMLLLNFFTLLIIGLIHGMIFEVLIFMLAYVPLRSYAGGFHAETHMKCYLVSVIIINAVLLIIKNSLISISIYCLLAFFSLIIIFILAPVEDKNKLLDNIETVIYRKKSRIILLVNLLYFIVALFIECFLTVKAISLSLTTLGVLLIIGKLKSTTFFIS